MTEEDDALLLSENSGLLLLQSDSLMTVSFRDAADFSKYCRERGVYVSVERLNRLERLGVFRPLFRVFHRDGLDRRLRFPNGNIADWISADAIVETYDPAIQYEVPPCGSIDSIAYYSVFQIDHLDKVLAELQLIVHLDSIADESEVDIDWASQAEAWHERARQSTERIRTGVSWRPIPVLCQYISNRYYPQTQTNQRTISVRSSSSFGGWLEINGHDWDWETYARNYDPREVEARFGLSADILERAYKNIGGSAAYGDPLEKWAPLVEFVSVDKKRKLKGKALLAQSLREAANMLRFLYKDLYGDELPPTHEIFGQVINHFPELEARDDARRHLEFVVNQYDLNPQPKLVLFVEGESEIVLINMIFEMYYGFHPGKLGIELVNLKGINNATGNKRADRFRAIFRLVDYLHHHQTLTFLILDNENHAEKLKREAKNAKSLHGRDRLAVPSDHIKLWRVALEFDNFSDTEIASAMSEISGGSRRFASSDVKAARTSEAPGQALSELYELKTEHSLEKPKLARALAIRLIDPKSRRLPQNRPIVRILDVVREKAALNPFPTRQKTWESNQSFHWLGGSKS